MHSLLELSNNSQSVSQGMGFFVWWLFFFSVCLCLMPLPALSIETSHSSGGSTQHQSLHGAKQSRIQFVLGHVNCHEATDK